MKFNCPEELAMTIAAHFDDVEPEEIYVGTWSYWAKEGDKEPQMKVSAFLKDGRLMEKIV